MNPLGALLDYRERVTRAALAAFNARIALVSPSEEAAKAWEAMAPDFFREWRQYMALVDSLMASMAAARRRPNRGSRPSRYARGSRRGRRGRGA